jgi:hypothetical protein
MQLTDLPLTENSLLLFQYLYTSAWQLKPNRKPKYKFVLFAQQRSFTLELLFISKQNVDGTFPLPV